MGLIDIENIDYVRLEDSLHCLEHHKGDEVECVICAPIVEAIPKVDYENRLKADLKAILDEFDLRLYEQCEDTDLIKVKYVRQAIQEKINSLEGEHDPTPQI